MRQTFENNTHHHALDGRNLGSPFAMQHGKVVLLPVPIAPISEGLQPHPVVLFHALLPEGSIRSAAVLLTICTVIGTADELTGQAVFAFVTLKPEFAYNSKDEASLLKELILQVCKVIGPFAAPKKVIIVPDLPKTRSGKIMRRIMRKIVAGEGDQLGDLSTIAEPGVVEVIKKKVAASM